MKLSRLEIFEGSIGEKLFRPKNATLGKTLASTGSRVRGRQLIGSTSVYSLPLTLTIDFGRSSMLPIEHNSNGPLNVGIIGCNVVASQVYNLRHQSRPCATCQLQSPVSIAIPKKPATQMPAESLTVAAPRLNSLSSEGISSPILRNVLT